MPNSNDRTRPSVRPGDQQDIVDTDRVELQNTPGTSDPEHYKVSDTITGSTPSQTAAYMADMLSELRSMAQKSGHISLGEMLEFAHREAVWRSRSDAERDKERDNSS